MNTTEIISAIGDRGRLWTIGITNDPKRRRKEHEQDDKDTKHWHDWEADSVSVARDVERHFKNKGMDGGLGGDPDDTKPVYVYIF